MLFERFLKPVGFMLEIPCKLSCSNIPGTVGQESKAAHCRLLINADHYQNLHVITMIFVKYQLQEWGSFPWPWWTDGRCGWPGRWESVCVRTNQNSASSSFSGEEYFVSWTPFENKAKQKNVKTCLIVYTTLSTDENHDSAKRVKTVNSDLLPAVLLQTVEQLIRVGEPEWQQLKVFVVTLKRKNVSCILLSFIFSRPIIFTRDVTVYPFQISDITKGNNINCCQLAP